MGPRSTGTPERRDVGELDGVVLAGADGLREVQPDLLGIDVEGGDELDVSDVIVAELHVHEPGHAVLDRRVTVVLNALHERGRAVPDAHDADSNLLPWCASFRERHLSYAPERDASGPGD